MSKSIRLQYGYLQQQLPAEALELETSYIPDATHEQNAYNLLPQLSKPLPSDLDVFSELPQCVYKNPRARRFFNAMKKCLLERAEEGLHDTSLSKLRMTEQSDSGMVIEWIYNYFRIYFSFDSEEGDYVGQIINDSVGDRFSNVYRKMHADEYDDVAYAEVDLAIMMVGGGT